MADRSVRARLRKDKLFRYVIVVPGVLVILPFFIILYHVLVEGVRSINWAFLFQIPKPVGETGGGILNGILGTLEVILIATVFAVPIGIGGGIYMSERGNHRLASLAKTAVNILQGVPSIVIGIVIYAWIVVPFRSFSALSGGIALAIMMLPVIVKSAEETINLVPSTLKEASLALGAPYYKTVFRVILPAGLSGILSGVMLAVARVAGETAPLLFTAFGNPYLNFDPLRPTASIPLIIYDYAKSPYQDWIHKAWGASLILILMVLALNLAVRLRPNRNKL
ncbi:MAG TPA: phosphate ABC transporter permease PstA [Spirochaetia bacterium]|nr:phosphate ABC transporter permease PstA [Spirochaetia bacterium]